LALILLAAVPLQAVFVDTGDPNRQDGPPESGEAWQLMGSYGEGGAVYLGKGWFITAGQLGDEGTTVRFRGEEIAIDPDTWTPVLHSLELSADALMFRAAAPEALPAQGAEIPDRELAMNDPLTLIGPGRDVGEVVRVENEQRFYQGDSSSMKWGRNLVSAVGDTHDGKGFRSRVFDTSLAHGEAQALEGDLGGGVFLRNAESGTVNLAGIIIQATLRKDERGTYAYKVASTDSLDSSRTRSVELFHYRDQIRHLLMPRTSSLWVWGVLFIGFVIWMVRVVRRLPAGGTGHRRKKRPITAPQNRYAASPRWF
jgi:hypothetical protein